MAKIGELRRQVEAEPDDHRARWRLAKVLYADSDYREALAHLRILKNEWERRLNVLRYLAASYYRLGRYDEAIGELLDCIETWPNEISLHEQLAKVYSAAGREPEAVETWGAILELDPDNRMARNALKRRSGKPAANTPYPVSAPHESDDGVDLRPVKLCPQCGAQNSAEFERCWQCGSELGGHTTPLPMRADSEPPELPSRVPAKVGGALFFLLMAAALFVTVRYVPAAFSDSPLVEPPRTVAEVLLRELAPTRLTLWVALILTCPLAIVLAAKLLNIKSAGARVTFGLGVGVATAVYLGSWLPVQYLGAVIVATTILTLPITLWMVGANMVRGVVVWLALLAASAATTAVVYFAFIGWAPFEQAAAITDFAARHDAQAMPGAHPEYDLAAPAEFQITWGSTGSSWLDGHTNEVAITLAGVPVDPPVRLELYLGRDLAHFVEIVEPETRARVRVQAGTPHRAVLRGPAGYEAALRLDGVLTPTLVFEE